MRTLLGFGLAVLVVLVGCNSSEGGGASSGGSGKTSLTKEQIDDAYKLCDADKVDKSLSAVTGKLGAPQKTEGDTSIWYGKSKDNLCYQLKISKTKGIESGTTDKASCGL